MIWRLSALCRRILTVLPSRQRAALAALVDRVFNAGPDWPFLTARRRYRARLVGADSIDPPAVLRLAAFRRHIPSSIESFEILGRPDIRMLNVESIGTQVIFWTGNHWVAQHGAGLEVWERLCARAMSVVEIGANVGYYAIAGGRTAPGAYAAYEPHPRSCDALRSNLALNGVDGVMVVEAAVVPPPAPSTVELMCPTGTDHAAPAGAMVRGSPFDGVVLDAEALVVAAVSFDVAIEGSDVVKIDVEGLEASLLEGSWRRLIETKPVIMVEIHDFNLDLRALTPKLLDDLDARPYAMRRDHLVPVARDVLESGRLAKTYGTWDFLIVPSERAEMIAGLVTA